MGYGYDPEETTGQEHMDDLAPEAANRNTDSAWAGGHTGEPPLTCAVWRAEEYGLCCEDHAEQHHDTHRQAGNWQVIQHQEIITIRDLAGVPQSCLTKS